jgi:hypothetical protein
MNSTKRAIHPHALVLSLYQTSEQHKAFPQNIEFNVPAHFYNAILLALQVLRIRREN